MFDGEYMVECSLKCEEKNPKGLGSRQDRKIRRQIANSNERKRMKLINSGFESLRTLLPNLVDEKISKAAILQQAALYIVALIKERDQYKDVCRKLGFDMKDTELAVATKKRKLLNINCGGSNNASNSDYTNEPKASKSSNSKQEFSNKSLKNVDVNNNGITKINTATNNNNITSSIILSPNIVDPNLNNNNNSSNILSILDFNKDIKLSKDSKCLLLESKPTNPLLITNSGLLINYQLASPPLMTPKLNSVNNNNNNNHNINICNSSLQQQQQISLNSPRLITLPILFNSNTTTATLTPASFDSASLLSPQISSSSSSSPSLHNHHHHHHSHRNHPGSLDIIIEAINHVENKTRRSINGSQSNSSSCNASPNHSEESELDSDQEVLMNCSAGGSNMLLRGNQLCNPLNCLG